MPYAKAVESWRVTGGMAPTDKEAHNEYWKLGSYVGMLVTNDKLRAFLKQHHYKVKTKLVKDELLRHLGRYQQGVVCYGNCALTEIRQFGEDRGLLAPGTVKKASRATLSDLLERADEASTFYRFLDLPAELRNTVYQPHAQWLGGLAQRDPFNQQALENEKARMPFNIHPMAMVTLPAGTHEPPFLLANRQLRNEALPIFYHRLPFHLDYFLSKRPDHLTMASRQSARMPEATFAHIRYLRFTARVIVLRTDPLSRGYEQVVMECEVKLGNNMSSAGVHSLGVVGQSVWPPVTTPIASHNVLDGAIESVMAREGVQKLRKADLRTIERALREDIRVLVETTKPEWRFLR